jgi:hypothetical protein
MKKNFPTAATICLLIVCLLVFCSKATAQVITFETTPDGSTPFDDSFLNSPYNIAGGTVRFFFDKNGNNKYDPLIDVLPEFEKAGKDTVNAFASAWDSSSDMAKPGYAGQLGTYFLRVPGVGPTGNQPPDPPGPFIAQYITTDTITALSGEIWDIDGGAKTEQFRIEVLNSSGNVLATELSPLGDNTSLDSLPWVFSFQGLSPEAESVRLTFIGTKSGGAGFALNNFSVTMVPEPSSIALLAIGAVGFVVKPRRIVSSIRPFLKCRWQS